MTLSDRSGHFLEKSIFDPKMTISCKSLFSFWPVAIVFLWPISGLTTVIGRSVQELVEARAVLAGVPKTSFKKSLLGLNATCSSGCSSGIRPAREGAKHSPARHISTK